MLSVATSLPPIHANRLDHAGLPRDIRPLHDPGPGKVARFLGPDFGVIDVEINGLAIVIGDDADRSRRLIPIFSQSGHGASVARAIADGDMNHGRIAPLALLVIEP